MSSWCIVSKTLTQAELAVELSTWLDKIHEGVFLFREGATTAGFDWASTGSISESKLGRLWTVRLFCVEYELYARRLDYTAGERWQLRIAAGETHLLSEIQLDSEPEGDETILLLGEARGGGVEFNLRPNRYRSGKLSYPGTSWQQGDHCGLQTTRYKVLRRDSISDDAAIVCWKQLKKVAISMHRTKTEEFLGGSPT